LVISILLIVSHAQEPEYAGIYHKFATTQQEIQPVRPQPILLVLVQPQITIIKFPVNPDQISKREEDMRKALKGELKTNPFVIRGK